MEFEDLGFDEDIWEILHPLGKIGSVVEVPSHDAVCCSFRSAYVVDNYFIIASPHDLSEYETHHD